MRKIAVAALLALTLACTRADRHDTGRIRAAFPTVPDAGDVPALMALDNLREQGYTVETTYFASPDLAAASLADGRSDIGHGSMRTYWAAIAKGAKIHTIAEQQGNPWSLVVRESGDGCAVLEGKRIAVNSAGSISNALLTGYLSQNCPGVRPKVLFISGSDNRAAALEAKEIDGALLELSDVMELERRLPRRFRVVIDYAQALPMLATAGVHVNTEFARQHPQSVRDYVQALLRVHREIQTNAALLESALMHHLEMDRARAQEIATAYLARKIWDSNGALSRPRVDYSLKFFQDTGSLPSALQADGIADLSFLDSARR